MTLKAGLAVLAALAGGLATAPAHANLIINGDFNAGVPNHPGWVTSGNIFHRSQQGADFWFGAGTTAENGPGIIAFNAGQTAPNGSIFQSFGTVAGASYVFEFDFGGTENTTQRIIAAVLGVNGTTPLFSQVVSDTNLPGAADNSLSHFTFLFIADGSQATVRFTDCAGNSQCSPMNPTINVDGVLDNVSVTGPAPASEPVTLALLGLGLAGLLSRRRLRVA